QNLSSKKLIQKKSKAKSIQIFRDSNQAKPKQRSDILSKPTINEAPYQLDSKLYLPLEYDLKELPKVPKVPKLQQQQQQQIAPAILVFPEQQTEQIYTESRSSQTYDNSHDEVEKIKAQVAQCFGNLSVVSFEELFAKFQMLGNSCKSLQEQLTFKEEKNASLESQLKLKLENESNLQLQMEQMKEASVHGNLEIFNLRKEIEDLKIEGAQRIAHLNSQIDNQAQYIIQLNNDTNARAQQQEEKIIAISNNHEQLINYMRDYHIGVVNEMRMQFDFEVKRAISSHSDTSYINAQPHSNSLSNSELQLQLSKIQDLDLELLKGHKDDKEENLDVSEYSLLIQISHVLNLATSEEMDMADFDETTLVSNERTSYGKNNSQIHGVFKNGSISNSTSSQSSPSTSVPIDSALFKSQRRPRAIDFFEKPLSQTENIEQVQQLAEQTPRGLVLTQPPVRSALSIVQPQGVFIADEASDCEDKSQNELDDLFRHVVSLEKPTCQIKNLC
ncbi:hypothetical protein HK096_004335, partial [Nowakowskiella sp. JEL0078]